MKRTLIIATPHSRYDELENHIRRYLKNYDIIRIHNRDELTIENLEKIQPEMIFFPHWSWTIPEDIFTQFECIVFHMTDLPYGRGGSPLQNLIIRGHTETQLTALRCEKGLDAGPIYLKRLLSLSGTAEQILRQAALLMEEMIIEIVEKHPVPVQQEGEPTIFKRRTPADGDLSPLMELDQIFDYIRMLDADGYPPAFIETEHFLYEFREAEYRNSFVDARVRIKRKYS